MAQKKKILRTIRICICVLLALILIIAGVLFFPLQGEQHTQIWSAGDEFDISKIQAVSKDREDFKILMFTDTQLWADLRENKKCYEQMDALVEKTQPDLIVLPGDNLSALASRFSINNFIKHMDSYKIPWAPVFGNHDSEIPTTSRNWQADKYMDSEYCLMEKGPSNLYGCGNY
ncbi:MAG: metallophosphoesterase, partial [Eubacterium sp.]